METKSKVLESNVPFEKSLIWDLNRSYYKEEGLSAWSDGVVPHNMTSNTFVGKTYAALIIGFLKDLSKTMQFNERVYIAELGSGHGRLAFHILKHLDAMIEIEPMDLPDYCYVLTDIVESNLDFFSNHHQLQTYYEKGNLDVAFYDAVDSNEMKLRNTNLTLSKDTLNYPLIILANYFFDSIPTEIYTVHNGNISIGNLTIESNFNIDEVPTKTLLKSLKTTFDYHVIDEDNLSPIIKGLLTYYQKTLKETYLLIPSQSIQCIENLKQISKNGLMLLSIDKGISELKDLENQPEPELVSHGSFSLYVNFHAIQKYVEQNQGKSMFASFSDYSLKLACFLMGSEADNFKETNLAYDHYVNDFGPDDFNGMKKMLQRIGQELNLRELITALRMSYYDSNLFIQLLPYIKQRTQQLTIEERKRLGQTLHKIGNTYFDIKEPVDTLIEIGGLFYDLGFYKEALFYFEKIDPLSPAISNVYYNKALCFYQLRMDSEFTSTLEYAKLNFPTNENFAYLETLDLNAK